MQHISPSWHCERETRRGPSNRLTTNLLYLATLFLFALMPRVGWAQTTSYVNSAQGFREALEDPNVTLIYITAPITLDKGHLATKTGSTGKPFNSVYLVNGTKTINGTYNGTRYTITRGEYRNNTINLAPGANLTVKNANFNGANIPNYASLFAANHYTTYGETVTTYVNASLTIENCLIENCVLIEADPAWYSETAGSGTTDPGAYIHPKNSNGANYLGNDWTFSWREVHNTGGAAINFSPEVNDNNSNSNKITIKNTTFQNNVVKKGTYYYADGNKACGGAVFFGNAASNGGTIEGCTFIKNQAGEVVNNVGYGLGGAIVFYESLTVSDSKKFEFKGNNVIGGSSANKNWCGDDGGGIVIEGGKVIIDGKTNISYNTAGNMGGGISLRGGWLYFQSSNNDDHVHIHHNEAGFNTNSGSGGGIFVEPYMANNYMKLSNNPNVKLTISNNTCTGKNVNNGFGGGIYIGGYDQDIWDTQKHFFTLESASTNPTATKRILISDNEADDVSGIDSRGGGISVRQNVVATFTKCIIKGNKAKGYGGGISLYMSNATFNGCLIEYNHAWSDNSNNKAHGGGVSVEQNGDNQFIGDTIRYNGYVINGNTQTTKTHNGGGVSITSGGKVEFGGTKSTDQCHIHQNKAIDGGGGLYMDSDNGILKGGCYVEDNTATNGGGIYYKSGGFENTNYVYSNIATNGGGVYVDIGNQKELKGLVIGSDVVAANVDRGNRAQYGGGIYANVGGNLTLKINDCKIVYNKWQSHADEHIDIIKGGGLYMSESYNYTVDLKGGTIIEYNEAKDGGGVYVSDFESGNLGDKNLILQLTYASLSYNKATTGHGGGIYNEKKEVQSNNATNVTLNGNKALAGNGGGIYNDGTCTLNNCRIGQSGNSNGNSNGNSALNGGGIYNNTNRTTNLGGNTTFENNEATKNGGGLYNDGTTGFNAGNINFTGNNATKNGGGLYNKWQVTQAVACTLAFVNDTATGNGGGVYHTRGIDEGDNTDLTLNGATFRGNHAVKNGGGIYTEHTCILNGCHIGQYGNSNGNSALNGGGIYKRKRMLTISGGEVSNNTASNNGGGIYLEDGTSVDGTYVNDSCLIQWNEATSDGGGIYLNGQHGFEKGQYVFYSCAILKHDGITEGPTIDIDLRKLRVVSGTYVTLFEYGSVISGSYLDIQNDGIISNLGIYYYEMTSGIEVGDYFLLRLKKQYSNNVFAEVKVPVSYDPGNPAFPLWFPPNYNYSGDDVRVENYDVVAISSTITLNGCTVGGETGKGNEATNGGGGGIYISPNATAIMTSDGTSTAYSNGIRNDVTHNQADNRGGGVYKDGTLKVEGWVVITDNEAGVSPGKVPENVYIPPGSDDEQTILIIGELVCESSIGVTKTKKWMEEGANEVNATSNVASPQYGNQGEHIYERDLFFKQVNTPIAQVSSTGEELWAEDAFYKRIYFDDKGYYRVWSFDFNNQNLGDDYSDQKDYFIETWRSFAASDFATANQIEDAPEFALLAKKVNDGNSFNQSAFQQTTTIDLAAHHWEPIGYTFCGECEPEHRPFAGTYNGNGHFILNVVSLLPEKEMGLFGYVTGTVKHTFTVGDQFYNTHDHAYTNHSSCTANLGALVGSTTGTIDDCEAANYLLHVHYQDNDGTIAAGGIAGNVGAGEVRNCFTSHINFYEDYGTFQDCGGLVGNIASGSKVKNCYTKVNIPAEPLPPGNYAALVGNNDGEFENAYTSATTGVIVGSGTDGTNVYSAGASGATATYTPAIGADHLGYMCIDNGVPYSTCGLTAEQKRNLIEGKDYFKFNNANGNEVELIPLYRLLNLNAKALNNNSDNYIPYTEWARPALAYYDGLGESAGATGSIKRPINLDLPLLMLNNYDDSPYIGQGGFRSVGTYGGIADILQYGGPDRDGNELETALIRTKVTVMTPPGSIDGTAYNKDFLFVYGDVTESGSSQLDADDFTQAKVSIYEHAAMQGGILADFDNTYVGITFDNSKKIGISTDGINFIDDGLSLPRNWHMISTPLINAPLGFNYPGDQNTNTYPAAPTTNNANSGTYYNNPWGDEEGSSHPNYPSDGEFSWLGNSNYATGHNRYWMYGWTNSRDAGTHDASSYPGNTWIDGYFPSKVNTSAIQFGEQLFITFADGNGSNEYVNGNHRYPYGMDFYSWTEPDYHYINFKRNGPNHWHSDTPHVHLDYKSEIGSNNVVISNNKEEPFFAPNVNETHLITGKGYMATIHIPTFLQASGILDCSDKFINVTYNENYMDFCEGWNLVGNPFHAYLDFNEFSDDNADIHNKYIVYNSNGFGSKEYDDNSRNFGNGFSYYVNNGSTGGAYAHRYLHPHQGFFVRINGKGTNHNEPDTVRLNFEESHTVLRSQIGTSGSYRDDNRPAYPLVNLFLTSDKGCSDVCVVEFNRPEWGGATKMREMYSGNGLFYAFHNDDNYAALFATPDMTRIPIKFESKDKDGDTYTIHWNTQNGDFYKLILVDNITGVQYDMLRNSSYSFSGKKSDYWTRFYITFEVTGLDEEQDEDDDASTGTASTIFAFFDGSQWVVTNDGHGPATLDIIDLQGRVLHSTTLAEGQAHIGLPDMAKGMYLMRMTNQNGMFVQKIVVK